MSFIFFMFLSGICWPYEFKPRNTAAPSGGHDVTNLNRSGSPETYSNEDYGFAIKYTDDLRVVEFPPEPVDSYFKLYIPNRRGGFAAEVMVFRNDTPIMTYEQIHEIINKWYGYPEGTRRLPFNDASEEQYHIGDRPAIRMDYLEHSEDPSRVSPASIVFTANEHFIYRLACCCNRSECNGILRSFEFINIDWEKHVVKKDLFDSPSLIKLKVLRPTVTTTAGQKVIGWFVIRNMGPSYALSPMTAGPWYFVRVYDMERNLLFQEKAGLYGTMKSGEEIKLQWGTTTDQHGETKGPMFLILTPGEYELQVDLLLQEDHILDTITYIFDVKQVD